MKKSLAVLLISAVAFGLAACGGSPAAGQDTTKAPEPAAGEPAKEEAAKTSGDKIIIKCGIPSPATSMHAVALNAMNEYLAQKGLVEIEIYTDSVLGTERELPESVSMGTVEMAVIACSPLVNYDQSFYMLDFPYLVNDRYKALDTLNGEVGRKLLSKLESSNIYGLGFYDQGFREVENNIRAVNGPADMANLKLRTLESDLFTGFFSAMGANPVIMSNSEIITSLEQGTIDGVDYTLSALYSSGTYSLVDHLAVTDHIFSTLVPIINRDLWNGFSAEVQEELNAAMEYGLDYMKDYMQELEEQCIETFEEEGIAITYPDKEAFKEATSGVADVYMDRIDQELYQEFLKALE